MKLMKITLTLLLIVLASSPQLIYSASESGTTVVRDLDGISRIFIKNTDSGLNAGARAGIKLLVGTADSVNIYVDTGGNAVIETSNYVKIQNPGGTNIFVINNNGEVINGTWKADAVGMAYGGLGTDVSAYSGLYKFNTGSLSQLTTKSALAGEISDLSHIVEHSVQVDNIAGDYLSVDVSNILNVSTDNTINSGDDSNLANQAVIYDFVTGEVSGSTHDPVTLAGVPDYLTLTGQEITRGVININDDTNLIAGNALTLSTNTLNFDGGASPAGDLGGTWATPTVDDDSHNHVIANIDAFSAADFNAKVTDGALDDDDVTALDVGTVCEDIKTTGKLDWSNIELVGNDPVGDDDFLYFRDNASPTEDGAGDWRLGLLNEKIVWQYHNGTGWIDKEYKTD